MRAHSSAVELLPYKQAVTGSIPVAPTDTKLHLMTRMHTASVPSGHFFVDEMPEEITAILRNFLALADQSP